MGKQEQSCCYNPQIHYSLCSFFDNLFGTRLRVFSVYEFGTLVFSTNGYYNDKHKWLPQMDDCNRLLQPLAFVSTISPHLFVLG